MSLPEPHAPVLPPVRPGTRPQEVTGPLACRWCGISTPAEKASHPDDGGGWALGWSGRSCASCSLLAWQAERTGGRNLDLFVVMLADVLGSSLDPTDRAVVAVARSADLRFCNRGTSRLSRGASTRWAHVGAGERDRLRAALAGERARLVVSVDPHASGIGCAGCGVATASAWQAGRVAVAPSLRTPGRSEYPPLCAATSGGGTSCAALLDAAGASGPGWHDRLAGEASGLVAVVVDLAAEVTFRPHAGVSPYDAGTVARWEYLGANLDRLKAYVCERYPASLRR